MTIPERAPMAPGSGDTQPFPRPPAVSRPARAAAGGEPSESQAAQSTLLTQPEIEVVRAQEAAESAQRQADRAAIEADRAAAARRGGPAVVVPRRDSIVTYMREHPGVSAGTAAAAVLLACVGGLLFDRLVLSKGEIYGIPSTTPGLVGPEYACTPATDLGAFPNGTTIDISGKGGAIVDDTQPGQQTQVAVIPPNTHVSLSGAVHEWVYNPDCTLAQITQQAKDHATAAHDTYVSDYHSLSGTKGTTSIGINAALSDYLRSAQQTLQDQPKPVRFARSVGRKLGMAV